MFVKAAHLLYIVRHPPSHQILSTRLEMPSPPTSPSAISHHNVQVDASTQPATIFELLTDFCDEMIQQFNSSNQSPKDFQAYIKYGRYCLIPTCYLANLIPLAEPMPRDIIHIHRRSTSQQASIRPFPAHFLPILSGICSKGMIILVPHPDF